MPVGIDAFVGLGARLLRRTTVWMLLTPAASRSSSAFDWIAGPAFWSSRSSWNIDSWELLARAWDVSPRRPTARDRTASSERTDGNKEREFMWGLLPVGCLVRGEKTYKRRRVARVSPYPDGVLDAESLLTAARRPLVIGIGGGGDVVGALATAEAARLYHGAEPVVGGVAWERRPIDPEPGPRALAEIEGGEELAPCVLLAGPDTRVRAREVLFGESRMAALLGQGTVLVDVTPGPAAVADGIAAAADRLGS